MTVKTYNPKVSVTLIKTVTLKDGTSARYQGGTGRFDLTPFLGESGAVRTRKSIHEPDGRFSITFPDKMEQRTQDSLYGLLAPMDIIEIRGTRRPDLYPGGPDRLPLIMRGIVSSVSRGEGMGDDGKPSRTVVVHGQDAGKFWIMHTILFEVAAAQEQPMLLDFSLNSALGLDTRVYGLSDYMTTMVNQVMNPKLAAFSKVSGQEIAPFAIQASVKRGAVIPQKDAPFTGPIWQLMERYAERPWNELFIVDEETGPVLVFREVPFRDTNGKTIMPDAVSTGTWIAGWEDVIQWNVTRSDAGIANFFWVPPGASMLDTNQVVTVASWQNGQPLDFNYANNLPTLYGVRKMEVPTRVVPTDLSELPSKLPPEQKAAADQQYVAWHLQRMNDLKALNRDNVLFEQGIAVVRGSELAQIGQYLSVTRGKLTFEAYMSTVEHAIVPLQSWTSTLGLERGTGFLERARYAGSPYLAEGRPGPYTASVGSP